jgi:hypothetical protein
MTFSIDLKGTAAGIAALSIWESLLLAPSDLKIMGEKEVGGVLEDAAATHRKCGRLAIIDRIIVDGILIP